MLAQSVITEHLSHDVIRSPEITLESGLIFEIQPQCPSNTCWSYEYVQRSFTLLYVRNAENTGSIITMISLFVFLGVSIFLIKNVEMTCILLKDEPFELVGSPEWVLFRLPACYIGQRQQTIHQLVSKMFFLGGCPNGWGCIQDRGAFLHWRVMQHAKLSPLVCSQNFSCSYLNFIRFAAGWCACSWFMTL